jgi:hypothetical protein
MAFDTPEGARIVDLEHGRQMRGGQAVRPLRDKNRERMRPYQRVRFAGILDLELRGRIHAHFLAHAAPSGHCFARVRWRTRNPARAALGGNDGWGGSDTTT